MRIKIIISCWPTFKQTASKGLRQSLAALSGGGRILDTLDTHDEFRISAHGFMQEGIEFGVYPSSHCYLSVSKNRGANGFNGCTDKHQKIDCDGILFLDADHSFEPKQIMSLIRNQDAIVGAAYPYRSNAGVYVAGSFDPNGRITGYVPTTAKGRIRVDWVGGGFVFIPERILEVLEYPWFRRGVIDCGGTAEEMGEDIGLCLQAKKLAVPVYCDCDCVAGHGK